MVAHDIMNELANKNDNHTVSDKHRNGRILVEIE